MLYSIALEIIKRNSLVPRRVSKAVLKAIAGNARACPPEAAAFLSEDNFARLKAEHAEVIARLRDGRQPISPRNLPFYIMVQNRIPGFKWAHSEPATGLNRYVVKLEQPLVQGLLPSLLSLLTLPLANENTSWSHPKFSVFDSLPPRAAALVAKLIEVQNFALPDEAGMRLLADWIDRGLRGRPLTVLTPICPDYEAQLIAPNLYRYTFAQLGSGIGVVGKRYLQAFPDIARALDEVGLNVRYVVAIGDFEAFSPENCARLNVSEDEFLRRLVASQKVFSSAAPVPVETPLFTELCGGRTTWERIYNEAFQALEGRNYGQSGLTETRVRQIAEARAPLYRRWSSDKDIDPVKKLIAQGAEYATMGVVAASHLENVLIIGADHWKMAPFFSCAQRVPILYLKPNYADIG